MSGKNLHRFLTAVLILFALPSSACIFSFRTVADSTPVANGSYAPVENDTGRTSMFPADVVTTNYKWDVTASNNDFITARNMENLVIVTRSNTEERLELGITEDNTIRIVSAQSVDCELLGTTARCNFQNTGRIDIELISLGALSQSYEANELSQMSPGQIATYEAERKNPISSDAVLSVTESSEPGGTYKMGGVYTLLLTGDVEYCTIIPRFPLEYAAEPFVMYPNVPHPYTFNTPMASFDILCRVQGVERWNNYKNFPIE